MKTTCKECGSKIDVDVPTDTDILNRISALERANQPKPEDLSVHLSSCPNCQKAISDIVKKKFDVEENEEDKTDDDEED